MMNSPLVSVLMTAYNREKYIAEAIESVLASTYTNFELIIADDCSADNTVSIAKQYAAKDGRIKLFVNEKNFGQFFNRNRVASLAKGTYLKYLDSDDIILPDSLKIMVEGMKQNPKAGLGMEFNNCSILTKDHSFPFVLQPADAYLWHFEKGGLLFPPPSVTIYRKDIFEKVKGFSEKNGTNADVELNLKVAAVSSTIVYPSGLIIWRRHSGQTAALQEDNEFAMMQERFNIHQQVLHSDYNPLNEVQLKRILFSQRSLYLRRAVKNFLFRGRLKSFFKLMNKEGFSVYQLPSALIPLKLLRKAPSSNVVHKWT
jgi:glycosyltransferase involved in cell wall biosynthesis